MYVRSDSFTVTLSTVGLSTAQTFSTNLNGLIHSVVITPAKATPSSFTVELQTTYSTASFLIVKDPSTAGSYYYPRLDAHSSSGATLQSSWGLGVMVPLDGRVAAQVTTSSSAGSLPAETMTVEVFVV